MMHPDRWRQPLAVAWAGGTALALVGVAFLVVTGAGTFGWKPPFSWGWVLLLGAAAVGAASGARIRDPWRGAGVAATAASVGWWLAWMPGLAARAMAEPDPADALEALFMVQLTTFWQVLAVAAALGAAGGLWTRRHGAAAPPVSVAWPVVAVRVLACAVAVSAAIGQEGTDLVAAGTPPVLLKLVLLGTELVLGVCTAIAVSVAGRWWKQGSRALAALHVAVVAAAASCAFLISLLAWGTVPFGVAWLPLGAAAGALAAWIQRPFAASGLPAGELVGEALWAGTVSVPLGLGAGGSALLAVNAVGVDGIGGDPAEVLLAVLGTHLMALIAVPSLATLALAAAVRTALLRGGVSTPAAAAPFEGDAGPVWQPPA